VTNVNTNRQTKIKHILIHNKTPQKPLYPIIYYKKHKNPELSIRRMGMDIMPSFSGYLRTFSCTYSPLFIPPSTPPQSLLPHTPVMCRYTLGWLLFHDRLLLPGAETHLIVNIWAITIAN